MPIASPIMVTTLLSRFDTGSISASRKATPSETVVVASPMRNGRPAATKVPNAIIRMIKVNGRACFSAWSPPVALQAFTSKSAAGPPVTAALAEGSRRRSAARSGATASRTWTTARCSVSLSVDAKPTSSNVTCPSAERKSSARDEA